MSRAQIIDIKITYNNYSPCVIAFAFYRALPKNKKHTYPYWKGLTFLHWLRMVQRGEAVHPNGLYRRGTAVALIMAEFENNCPKIWKQEGLFATENN